MKQAPEDGEEKRGTGKAVGVVAARLYKNGHKHQTGTQSKKPGICVVFYQVLMCVINLSWSVI